MATLLEFYFEMNSKEFIRNVSESCCDNRNFWLSSRKEATTRDNRKVKEPTNMLVLCARKSCLTGPRFSERDCF